MRIQKRNTIPKSSSEQILNYIASHGHARVHDLRTMLRISNVAVHKQLKKLQRQGKIKKIGTPPLVLYVLPKTNSKNLIQLEKLKRKVYPILMQADVKKAAFFGSYVRGDNTDTSDVDILVDLPRGKTLIDLVGLQQNLEELLKKKVDVVTYNGIHALIKDYILQYQYPIL